MWNAHDHLEAESGKHGQKERSYFDCQGASGRVSRVVDDEGGAGLFGGAWFRRSRIPPPKFRLQSRANAEPGRRHQRKLQVLSRWLRLEQEVEAAEQGASSDDLRHEIALSFIQQRTRSGNILRLSRPQSPKKHFHVRLQRAWAARGHATLPIHHELNLPILCLRILKVRQSEVKGSDCKNGPLQRAKMPSHLHNRSVVLRQWRGPLQKLPFQHRQSDANGARLL